MITITITNFLIKMYGTYITNTNNILIFNFMFFHSYSFNFNCCFIHLLNDNKIMTIISLSFKIYNTNNETFINVII